ncbi:hypothetical protein OG474_30215 [Kribbella sp. NBC_01505]|uniref:hypothetical protein n=1 Tax=Kribbella sp. NBC_01505 TaxID=2903580 RepID=UPI003867BF81
MIPTNTKVPSEYIHPVGKIQVVEDGPGGYCNELVNRGTTDLMHDDAEVVMSQIVGTDKHTLMIDLDVPATLIPSTTPGHSHLYIDVKTDWPMALQVLEALADAGVVEPGYVRASEARRCTTLRLPWVRKKRPEAVQL